MPINVRMTLRQALRQLEAERSHIDGQIAALRGALDGLGDSRLSRAPSSSAGPVRRRRRMSAGARHAASQRMKAYWAKRKASGVKGRTRRGRGK